MKQNKTLKRNLEIIAAINPTLSKWLSEEKDADWITEIKSKGGAKNLLITAGSRKENAFSMDNPMVEARKAVRNMQLYRENVSILVGFGLGYLVKSMLAKAEKGHRILVVEPVAHMIKLAFSNFNFTKALMNGSLIIVAPGTDEIGLTLAVLDSSFVIADWALTVNKYVNWRADEYGKLIQYTQNTLNQILSNTGTVAGAAGGIIATNDIDSLPWLIRHRGVVELKGLFKDKPAVIVSTGPSLAKNIHHLIGMEDRLVIIAVGQALRVLLAYGISPTVICTVDFGSVNFGHFTGLLDSTVPLVTINRAYAPLVKAWKGPKFVAGTPVDGQENTAAGILRDKGFISAGGSVAHLCFGLAFEIFHCNPIIFVGQDLALGETSHIPQADAMGKIAVDKNGMIQWQVDDQRCSLHGRKDLGMGNAIAVEGFFGGTVFTNAGLLSFKTAFEGMLDRYLKKD